MVRKARAIGNERHSQPNHAGTSAIANMMREPTADLMEHAKDYARERPEMAALCCFAVGFIMGWKLKPW